MTRKERMAKAEEMAGISFWVDLRKGRLTKYAIQKQVKRFLVSLFRYLLLVCLGFIIITPLWKLAKDAFTDPSVLSNKSSIWIPQKFSTIFVVQKSSELFAQPWVHPVQHAGVDRTAGVVVWSCGLFLCQIEIQRKRAFVRRRDPHHCRAF